MKLMNLNELPMPTWRWLNINETEMDFDFALDTKYTNHIISTNTERLLLTQDTRIGPIPGLPADMSRTKEFVTAHQNYRLTITIPKGVQLIEPVMIDFILDEKSPVLVDLIHIRAEEDSHADIILNYRNTGNKSVFHSGFSYLEAASNAHVRLFKIQMLGNEDLDLDTTAVQVAAAGQGDVIFCELGGKKVVNSCNLALTAKESAGNLDCLYLGSGERVQDFNYRLELKGAASEGEINVKGALTGTAKKTLKSTLDFISGAYGSKGREQETILTLSDKVVNLSAPLLLCGEDNVEGEHATSTGKPDQSKMYYLMSRGFTEKEAKQLLVEASFTPILNKIPSDQLRQAIYKKIQGVLHDEY